MKRKVIRIPHWGIWSKAKESWMVNDSGIIVWSTSRTVMQAQLNRDGQVGDEVRAFEPATEIILEGVYTQ